MKLELLIIDANVLIDFCKTDPSVLTLVTKHVGTLFLGHRLPQRLDLDFLGGLGARSAKDVMGRTRMPPARAPRRQMNQP